MEWNGMGRNGMECNVMQCNVVYIYYIYIYICMQNYWEFEQILVFVNVNFHGHDDL